MCYKHGQFAANYAYSKLISHTTSSNFLFYWYFKNAKFFLLSKRLNYYMYLVFFFLGTLLETMKGTYRLRPERNRGYIDPSKFNLTKIYITRSNTISSTHQPLLSKIYIFILTYSSYKPSLLSFSFVPLFLTRSFF